MKILKFDEYVNEKLSIQPISDEVLDKTDAKSLRINKPDSFCDNYRGKVFAYKIKNTNDRDAVNYIDLKNGKPHVDLAGQIIVEGPNFSSRCDNNLDYIDVETVLTKEEFEAFKNNNCPDEMQKQICRAVLSDDNDELVKKVKSDEIGIIAKKYNLDLSYAEYIVHEYIGDDYFDRGIVSGIFDDMPSLIEYLIDNFGAQQWLIDLLRNNANDDETVKYLNYAQDTQKLDFAELKTLNYDFDDIDVAEIADTYLLLDNGKICEYSV